MENTGSELKKIRSIKKITTGMDLAGLVLSLLAAVLGMILLVVSGNGFSDVEAWFSGKEYDELVGGYEVLGGLAALGGSLLVVIAFGLLAGFAILFFLVFLVPSVHGLVALSGIQKHLEDDLHGCIKSVRRDSVIKIIFNGIPGIMLAWDMIGGINALEFFLFAYFTIVCILEIYVFLLLR